MGASSSTAGSEPVTAESLLSDKQLKVTDLGDHASLKRCVDDATALVIMGNGYDEDVTYSNIRIVLSTIACIFALVAQLWPTPFPDNWYLLLVCVIGYIVFNTILTWHMSVNEGYAIMFTLPKQDASGEPGLVVSTQMKRYDENMTIIIAPHTAKAKQPSTRKEVKETFSITKWFDVNGLMDKAAIQKDVEALLKQYEAAGNEPKKSK